MAAERSDYRVLEADEAGVDAAQVGEFITEHWQRRIAVSVPRFFEWQFRGSPANSGRNRCLVVVDSNGRLHGFMGVTVRDFNLDGRRVRGAELTTWVIAETLRGLGFGKQIVSELRRSYEAITGMGVSAVALPVYMNQGFRHMRYLPRYVRIFDPDRVAPISKLDSFGERVIQRELDPVRVKFEAGPIGFREAGELAAALYPKFNFAVRDPDTLQWRYADHPFYTYEAFRVSDGHGEAAVVLRVDEVGELRVVHVTDFLGHEDRVPAVLAFLDELCLERGAALADFYCTADPIGHQFWSHGWLSSVDDHYIQVPNWFYPIDMRIPPTTSLMVWARADIGSVIDRSRLYVTKSDCDIDRPTMLYFEEMGITV